MNVAPDLAAALDGWMLGAEPGERSPYGRLAVHASAGTLLTSHELTHRQAAELAALIADTAPDTTPATVLAELRRFAGPVDRPALVVRVEEVGHHAAVGLSARAAGHLAELLDYGRAQRAAGRRLIAWQSPYQAGQRIQAGHHGAGTIAYITVTWPREANGQAELWYHVHLDQAAGPAPTPFAGGGLAPLSSAGPAGRPSPHPG